MYTHYFDFSRQPFADSVNQVFLDLPPHQATYTCLRQGLIERRGLLLLTGMAGVGKSTVLHRLMGELKDQAHCIFCWNAHLGFDDLLDYVCTDLDLHIPSGGQDDNRVQALEKCLNTRQAGCGKVVLVVDDAQNLPDETLTGLGRLAQLKADGRPLLQIVLSGQAALQSRLTELPLLQALSGEAGGHCQLGALDDDAVVLYIRERLRRAGHSGEGLFEQDALQEIIAHVQGIPRRINLLCSRALLLAYLNAEPGVAAHRVREVIDDQQLDWVPISIPSGEPHPAGATILSPHPSKLFLASFRHLRQHSPISYTPLLAAVMLGAVSVLHPVLVSDSAILSLPQTDAVSSIVAQESSSSAAAGKTDPTQTASLSIPSPIVPKPTAAKRISTLLEQAEQQKSAMRYTRPAGSSALDSYREILQLNPDNAAARQGIRHIKSSFVRWSDSAQARGDLARAQRHLETALSIDPHDKAVRTRLDRVRRAQESRTGSKVRTHRDQGPPRIEGWVNRD